MTDLTPEEAIEMEWVRYWRERAERAEAAVERMDAQLGRMRYELHKFDPEWLDIDEDRWHPFEALARVRALCDAEPTCWDDVQWQAAIRAAIDGPVGE